MPNAHLGRIVKISVIALALALALVAALALGLRSTQGSVGQVPATPEPPDAAAFITSQRDQDSQTASRVTSSLFHAELDRRGLKASWPLDPLWSKATSTLTFTYVDALTDRNGFTSVLYTARPNGETSPVTLWRLDLDPNGKVIWGDFLWLFSNANVGTVSASSASPRIISSLALARRQADTPRPCLVFGVVSTAGDGYLALGLNCWGSGRSSTSTPPVAYATIDKSGTIQPGYWSFGALTPATDASGKVKAPRIFNLQDLSPGDASTLKTYEASLSAQSVIGAGLSDQTQ